MTTAGWSNAPHLDERAIEELKSSIPSHELEARMNGIPTLGSGRIYSIPEDDFVIDPFPIPYFWFRCYGLDIGWKRTAAMFCAHDRETDTAYFYDELYAAEAVPAIHASGIRARGEYIPGAIDPAARGRSQADGEQMITLYRAQKLDLTEADNSVEAGIYEIRQRLLSGRLKVFRNCTNWLAEYRLYRRDEKGKVVKLKDHAQDAGRYCLVSGLAIAKQPPRKTTPYTLGNRIFTG